MDFFLQGVDVVCRGGWGSSCKVTVWSVGGWILSCKVDGVVCMGDEFLLARCRCGLYRRSIFRCYNALRHFPNLAICEKPPPKRHTFQFRPILHSALCILHCAAGALIPHSALRTPHSILHFALCILHCALRALNIPQTVPLKHSPSCKDTASHSLFRRQDCRTSDCRKEP